MKNYERLYQPVKRLINDRFSTFDRTISAEQFIEMPVCEQRRYTKQRTGTRTIIISRNSIFDRNMSHQQIDADFLSALR